MYPYPFPVSVNPFGDLDLVRLELAHLFKLDTILDLGVCFARQLIPCVAN